MSQQDPDWIEQSHRQAAEQYLEQQENQLMEQAHRVALEQYSEPPSSKPPSIYYSELQDVPADSPIRVEWKTYRRELPLLL